MLPVKITKHLKQKFKYEWKLLTKKDIHDYLITLDNEHNINQIYGRSGKLTKIIFHRLDGKTVIKFTNEIDGKKIMKRIRNGTENYHDYLTSFRKIFSHPIYDIIVEVKYQFVYD